jgi:hypothetical protein
MQVTRGLFNFMCFITLMLYTISMINLGNSEFGVFFVTLLLSSGLVFLIYKQFEKFYKKTDKM